MSGLDIPVLDHGVIGNGRVLALISPTTSIDWLCMPRFDSPSVFAKLLDLEQGGTFAFHPTCDVVSTRMEYMRNTNVLRTEVRCTDGLFDVFDYAPQRPALLRVTDGLEIADGLSRFYLRTNVPVPDLTSGQPVRIDEPRYFILSYGKPSDIDSIASAQRALDLTIAGWRAWAKTCALPSFADTHVLRSALCLKLHSFSDTGAIIAAATTSLPEALGTERTWDYRYCWLRDAAFVVEALRRLSHLAEGEAFVSFLRHVAEEGPLQPVYGIGGERTLPEHHLDHLSGFAGARPVRIGNAAYAQRQHDLMGEMILRLEMLMTDPRVVADDDEALFGLVERLVRDAMAAAPTEDTGPWEFRTLPARHTFSQVLCWVAAHRYGKATRAAEWDAWSDAQRADILKRAYDERLGFFTQAFDSGYPDASNLLLPTLGLVEPRDPRFLSTIRAYERLLVDDGLMLRYRNPDDLGDTTSAFSICSFWWAEALAMIGELDEAVALFNRLLTYANPVGLFSEDIDPPTGRLLGNFPQAYTHVGLIHAAITIGELIEARDAKFRAWT